MQDPRPHPVESGRQASLQECLPKQWHAVNSLVFTWIASPILKTLELPSVSLALTSNDDIGTGKGISIKILEVGAIRQIQRPKLPFTREKI